ncbi:MAG: hypothetical protein ACREAA_20680 [Candidatus Polarisedimenticolia bacterium]
MKRINRQALWALGLALPLLAVSGAAPAAAADDVIWMRVEVDRDGSEHGLVKINLPISLVEVVVDSIDKRDFLAEIESEHSIDIAKMWREIRRMEADEFLTVESDEEQVRVWKDRDYFRVNIREEDSSDPTVQVKIPLDVMDYVFESKRNWSFQDLVERVRPHLPLTLIEVNKDKEHVKIWLETR